MNIREPDFKHPHRWQDLFTPEQAEKTFGSGWAEFFAYLEERDRAVEDNLWRPEITASYAGAISTATSTPWHVKRGARLKELRVIIGTAGSSNTVVVINKNGSAVATVTLGSGTTAASAFVDVPFLSDSDTLTFQTTTAGTGAADLSAIARFI